MKCAGCARIEEKKQFIYEDDTVVAVIADKPAAPGHLLILTKQHHTIMEEVPDEVVGHAFEIANKLSSSLFEKLAIQGTNIMVQNGVAAGQGISHFSINIIPRSQNDNLDFQWHAQKPTEDEMSTAELKLKDALSTATSAREFPVTETKETEQIDEESYLVKHLRKIP